MIFQEKQIKLKSGVDCTLRSPGREDAEAVLFLLRQTAAETDFMSRYPEEVTMTVDEEAEFLENYRTDPNNLMISAEVDGRIIANIGLSCVMNLLKYRHRAVFGISVLKEYWNLGIGTILISELIQWAGKAGYEQLELEVVRENERAVRLYQRLGFEIYGTRERSFKFKDGKYSADHLMLLHLPNIREIKLERVADSDLDEIVRFATEVFTAEQHIPDQLVPISVERDPIWWSARIDGILVGVSAAWKEDGHWHWGRFAIDKKIRGFGIGKKMADYCLNEIFLEGAEIIYMEARDISVKLLEQFGSKTTGDAMDFYGKVVTPITLSKEDYIKHLK